MDCDHLGNGTVFPTVAPSPALASAKIIQWEEEIWEILRNTRAWTWNGFSMFQWKPTCHSDLIWAQLETESELQTTEHFWTEGVATRWQLTCLKMQLKCFTAAMRAANCALRSAMGMFEVSETDFSKDPACQKWQNSTYFWFLLAKWDQQRNQKFLNWWNSCLIRCSVILSEHRPTHVCETVECNWIFQCGKNDWPSPTGNNVFIQLLWIVCLSRHLCHVVSCDPTTCMKSFNSAGVNRTFRSIMFSWLDWTVKIWKTLCQKTSSK